jgi:uncharacterized protein YdaU (DUF1376 family)
MKKPNRVLDLAYYHWSILRWMTSDTRNLLDATGIGIYRELLDRCYAQGSIPAEPELQARISKCTLDQLSAVWPLIKSNFRAIKNHPERLENPPATLYRSSNFTFRGEQIRSGSNGGRAKANRKKDISRQPTRVADDDFKKPSSHILTNLPTIHTTHTNLSTIHTLPTNKAPQQFGDWPLAAAAIEEHFDADFPFLVKIAEAAAVALVDVDSPKIELTDEILAKAIRHSYRGATQTGAGLYLTTVPGTIRRWAKNGIRSRDSPDHYPDPPSPDEIARANYALKIARGEGA